MKNQIVSLALGIALGLSGTALAQISIPDYKMNLGMTAYKVAVINRAAATTTAQKKAGDCQIQKAVQSLIAAYATPSCF